MSIYDPNSENAKAGRAWELRNFNNLKRFKIPFKDLTQNENYFGPDIDCKIYSEALGVWISTELKTASIKYGNVNFYLPLIIRNKLDKLQDGWFIRCEASVLIYAIPLLNKVYILNFKEFKKDIEELLFKRKTSFGRHDYKYETGEEALIVHPWFVEGKEYCTVLSYYEYDNVYDPEIIFYTYNHNYYYIKQVQIARGVSQQQYDLEYNQFD